MRNGFKLLLLSSVLFGIAKFSSADEQKPSNILETGLARKGMESKKKDINKAAGRADEQVSKKLSDEELNQTKESLKQVASEQAQEILDKATLDADNLSYDKETKTVLAEGNVIFEYQGRELKADKIEYDQGQNIIKADKGVTYKDVNGAIFKSDSIEVTDQFDKGEMKNVNANMSDGSSFHADNLTIIDVNKYNLAGSTYSPCKPCEDGRYMWQFQSNKVIYDEEDGRVYYKNVYLKVFDKKVAWIPYISHPTPFAQSKSGFLSPSFGRSSDYGFFARVPYYYQPKSNLDFTFSPMILSSGYPVLVTEMRNLLETGYYQLEFSGTQTKDIDESGNEIDGSKFRGHTKGKGNFQHGDYWNYGFDFARTTDDTYLRRFKLGTYEDVLTSLAFVNKQQDRDYFEIKALSFQGLRKTDDPSKSPSVTPLINAGKTFDVSDNYNQKISTDFNTMVLKRGTGADSTRAIGETKWSADYVTNNGHILKLNIGGRADHYELSDVSYNNTQYSGSVSRAMPNLSGTWSFPLQKSAESYSMVIEPITMIVATSNGNNNKKISNEDSQNIEIYDYNLFQENHISGKDIVEDGLRANYGLRGVLSSDNLGDYNFLFGQNYRAKEDKENLTKSTGLAEKYSDYVGRVVTGSNKIQSSYRFRLDKNDFQFKRNEIGFNFNLDSIKIASGYTYISGTSLSDPSRQEIFSNTQIKLSENYNLIGGARRNLNNDENAGWVNANGGIEYKNDCLTTTFMVTREFTRDRDIKPSTDFTFKVNLVNFGS
jgi:LPS-assembly protein